MANDEDETVPGILPQMFDSMTSVEVVAWNEEDSNDELGGAEVLQAIERISISARDWTSQTIVDQIKKENIELSPRFQRRNAWTDEKRSRLIESLILGFPVPQIVLAEVKSRGRFVIIDGKQRLMTLASLYSVSAARPGWKSGKFEGLKMLRELNGVKLDAFLYGSEQRFVELRRQLENADIRSVIIRDISSDAVLYNIFYRLNTGSVPLSTQELRHAMRHGGFSDYLLQLTESRTPVRRILGIDAPDDRLRDAELVLRLVAFQFFAGRYSGNLREFLDFAMVSLNGGWSSGAQEKVLAVVGEIFEAATLLLKVFSPKEVGRKFQRGKFESQFNRSVFDVQVYFLCSSAVRAVVESDVGRFRREFCLLFEDPQFLSAVESTTKSMSSVRTRFGGVRGVLIRMGAEPNALPAEWES